MKWLDPIKPRNWGIVKVYRDIENFSDWKKIIKKEQNNPISKFNKWKLSRTKLFDIYLTLSLDENDAVLPESVQRVKLMETLNPVHRYLDEELGFAECLNCEFNQYVDENKKPTLTYLIVYRFNFNKLSIKWIVKNLIILGILTFATIKFLIPWVSTLI